MSCVALDREYFCIPASKYISSMPLSPFKETAKKAEANAVGGGSLDELGGGGVF